jgi:hypothetical protein
MSVNDHPRLAAFIDPKKQPQLRPRSDQNSVEVKFVPQLYLT